jgi:hypothetical protein
MSDQVLDLLIERNTELAGQPRAITL